MTNIVDRIGALKAQIAPLEKQLKKLQDELKAAQDQLQQGVALVGAARTLTHAVLEDRKPLVIERSAAPGGDVHTNQITRGAGAH